MVGTWFHSGNEYIRLYRRPAIEEHLAFVNPVPVCDFLLTYFRGERGIPAEALEVGTRDSQRHSRGTRDLVCVGVEPGLFRQFPAIRAAKARQVESRPYGLIGHGSFPVLSSGAAF